ncbi:MAG: protein-(glutamine-N5) methyltransferase, release factor-specific [Candidatus Magasanikbacteria bacterium RIFOXYC12_FULL_33_11]|uniref:Protein-(Glutamine-N5) methyltransferase, release factor-specific n=1 Tax=Candidatus Magasanikbacteria bacterium RIFOXYC12_FULL_33_11 TaxID=1798701 RepID=A0A1F6NMK6_9BACT|nr:MAG: protein-(glutamine-N5) methyltransferase, release factor-specific [Candidatus Magasanikbacteria bacterium RIFOXYC12_FULL_33_11]
MKQSVQKLLTTSSQKINKLDAEILLAHVIKKSRDFLFANPEFEISFWKKIKFENLVRQRQKNIPVAYLVGHKEFFGLDFFVNKNVLVPRPDTELMVENALQQINTSTLEHILLIDVGTGSGCIPISIIKTLKHKNIKTIAVDVSSKALNVAKKNAKKHNVEIEFLYGNLLEPILQNSELRTKNNELIITANLPYITEQQFKQEPSIQHEPKLALVADNDGLALYEELLQQIKQITNTYNLKPKTYFETDPSQTEKIKILIKKYLPESNIEVKKDLAGLDRLVIIT